MVEEYKKVIVDYCKTQQRVKLLFMTLNLGQCLRSRKTWLLLSSLLSMYLPQKNFTESSRIKLSALMIYLVVFLPLRLSSIMFHNSLLVEIRFCCTKVSA